MIPLEVDLQQSLSWGHFTWPKYGLPQNTSPFNALKQRTWRQTNCWKLAARPSEVRTREAFHPYDNAQVRIKIVTWKHWVQRLMNVHDGHPLVVSLATQVTSSATSVPRSSHSWRQGKNKFVQEEPIAPPPPTPCTPCRVCPSWQRQYTW